MIRRIEETKTEEYFLISRKQIEFISALFLKMGVWKILEIMDMERKSKDEEFVDEFYEELSECLVKESQ